MMQNIKQKLLSALISISVLAAPVYQGMSAVAYADSAVVISAPSNLRSTTLRVMWNPVAGADSYSYSYTDEEGNTVSDTTFDTYFYLPDEIGKTYNVWVSACAGGVVSSPAGYTAVVPEYGEKAWEGNFLYDEESGRLLVNSSRLKDGFSGKDSYTNYNLCADDGGNIGFTGESSYSSLAFNLPYLFAENYLEYMRYEGDGEYPYLGTHNYYVRTEHNWRTSDEFSYTFNGIEVDSSKEAPSFFVKCESTLTWEGCVGAIGYAIYDTDGKFYSATLNNNYWDGSGSGHIGSVAALYADGTMSLPQNAEAMDISWNAGLKDDGTKISITNELTVPADCVEVGPYFLSALDENGKKVCAIQMSDGSIDKADLLRRLAGESAAGYLDSKVVKLTAYVKLKAYASEYNYSSTTVYSDEFIPFTYDGSEPSDLVPAPGVVGIGNNSRIAVGSGGGLGLVIVYGNSQEDGSIIYSNFYRIYPRNYLYLFSGLKNYDTARIYEIDTYGKLSEPCEVEIKKSESSSTQTQINFEAYPWDSNISVDESGMISFDNLSLKINNDSNITLTDSMLATNVGSYYIASEHAQYFHWAGAKYLGDDYISPDISLNSILAQEFFTSPVYGPSYLKMCSHFYDTSYYDDQYGDIYFNCLEETAYAKDGMEVNYGGVLEDKNYASPQYSDGVYTYRTDADSDYSKYINYVRCTEVSGATSYVMKVESNYGTHYSTSSIPVFNHSFNSFGKYRVSFAAIAPWGARSPFGKTYEVNYVPAYLNEWKLPEITDVTTTSATVSWNGVYGARYAVELFKNGSRISHNTVTSTTYKFTDLQPDCEYMVVVVPFLNTYSYSSTDEQYFWTLSTDDDINTVETVTNVKLVNGENKVDISWSPVKGATSYNVYSYGDGCYFYQGNTTSTNYTVSNLVNGTDYFFAVETVKGGKSNVNHSTLVHGKPFGRIKNPGVYAFEGDSCIYLSWEPVEGAASYTVYTYDSGYFWKQAEIKETGYTLTGLTNGTKYGVFVQSNGSDGISGVVSENGVIYITPKSALYSPSITTAPGSNDVTLTWDAVPGADSYIVYTYDAGYFWPQGTTESTSFQVTGLAGGTTYGFAVRACAGSEQSALSESNVVYATTNASIYTPGLYILPGTTEISVWWDAVPGAESYIVYTYDSGYYWKQGEVTSTSFTLGNLTPGTTYGFVVQAYANGVWSTVTENDVVTAATKSVDIYTPSLYFLPETNAMNIWWDAVPDAEYYIVYSYDSGYFWQQGTTAGTSFRVAGLESGKEYGFAVQAYGRGVYSPVYYFNVSSVSTL